MKRYLSILFILLAYPIGSFSQPTELSTLFGAEGSTGDKLGYSLECLNNFSSHTGPAVVIGAPGNGGGMGLFSVYEWSAGDYNLVYSDSGSTGDELGYALAKMGEISGDGDGSQELAVTSNTVNGFVRIYCSSDPYNYKHDVSPSFAQTSDAEFGKSIAGLVDSPVLALGAPGYNGSGTENGAVEVIYYDSGCSGTLMTTKSMINTGTTTNGRLGHSLTSIGDIYGESGGDFLAGSPGHNTRQGAVFLIHDSPSNTYSHTITLAGLNSDEEFGTSVSNIGDIDGDTPTAVDDFIVGAPAWNSNTGRAYVYSGADIDEASPTPLCVLEGSSSGDRFGYVVKGLGDINDDNNRDFAVGIPGLNSSEGAVYIYSYDTSTQECVQIYNLFHPSPGSDHNFGASIGAGLVDANAPCNINGDSFGDLVVGSRNTDDTGSFYAFLGESGAIPTPTPTNTNTPEPTETPTPAPTATPTIAGTATVTPTFTPVPVDKGSIKKTVPIAPETEVSEEEGKKPEVEVRAQAYTVEGSADALKLVAASEPLQLAAKKKKWKVYYLFYLREVGSASDISIKGKKAKDNRKRLSKRNSTTFRKLKNGTNYQTYYKVRIKKKTKKGTKSKTSKSSPKTSFTTPNLPSKG